MPRRRRGLVELGLTAPLDAIGAIPSLPLTALLALDGDPDYEPLPFIEATRAHDAGLTEAGDLPADLDVEAVHLIGLATSIGIAIYADAAARQLDAPVDDLRARTRVILERMMRSLTATD